jgi:hypothetical protein
MAGLIYTKNSTDAVVTIENINFVFNGMALGFAVNNQYPHQPLFNLQTGDITLDNIRFSAADYDGDTEITATDYIKLKSYFLNN